jgi:hypothetical protein
MDSCCELRPKEESANLRTLMSVSKHVSIILNPHSRTFYVPTRSDILGAPCPPRF